MTLFLKQWKRYLTWAALFSCFVNILQLTFPFYMFTIYRNIVTSYSGVSLFNITVAAVFAVMILGLFTFLRSRLLAHAGHTLYRNMRKPLYDAMIRSCVVDPARAYRSGLQDLGLLQSYCSTPAVYALFDVPWAPFYLALIYLFHPVLGVVATLGALAMAGLNIVQELLVKESMNQANKVNNQNQGFVASFMRNAEVTNGMGMIGNITRRFSKGHTRVMKNQTRSSYYAGVVQSVIKPLQNVIQVFIYCFGAYFAMTQGFDVGLMVAGSIIMGRGLAPLMQFMSSWRQAAGARQAYKRLKGLSDLLDRREAAMPLPPPRGGLVLDKAAFVINKKPLVGGISFELAPGEFLGIIGPSGAGKTTLCRLILGIWPPVMGGVYLDGRSIFAWDKNEIGGYMGYLPQEIDLFPGTVAENIARLGEVDPEKLSKAVEISGCGPMIEGLPRGMETLLGGDGGIQLSGGQKQRIGLARALYGQPRFLVLDEPTSNLDEAGEQELLKALAGLKAGGECTCIMVTHKPSLLQSMDKILVVRAGVAAAFGPRDEVFAQLSGGQASGGAGVPKTSSLTGAS